MDIEDLNLPKPEESNKIRQLEEIRSAEIKKLDGEQFVKEEEMRRIAADELLKWHEARKELIQFLNYNNNRTKRQAAKTKIDQPEKVENRKIWSAALSFCESNVKHSKCTKDTSAYKNALIKMNAKSLSSLS
ncbi:hypothetical protein MXB_5348 [Myxobolus squamalis]|nr:hypothetical protein MXB_5348 [Myxobolus squamalis]